MYPNLLERFIKYAKVNTRSDMSSQTVPSTVSQKEFLLDLMDELIEMGYQDVSYDERDAYVVAKIASNINDRAVPAIGFIAHVDTADYPADNIQPQVHYNYDGEDVVLNQTENIVMKVAEFPNLKNYVGETLITTDGTTLLGADDKAGLVSIIEATKYFIDHPEIPHGDIWLAFGPDEEIGLGAHRFETDKFPADFAYTLDSGVVGKLEYETFNATSVNLEMTGTSVHPGQAKNVMVNALYEVSKFVQALPENERAETTSGYEGYYMLRDLTGNLDFVRANFNIRDHDRQKLEERKEYFKDLVAKQNMTYDYPRIKIDMYDQYYNMKEVIDQHPRVLELAKAAYQDNQIEPDIQLFRGGDRWLHY